ncbi:hypothetical protein EDB85DRAFT_1428683 [Lactarius pseudohatsudake]|nr:hypothetical protein EDB85DRAFT_1428683 [Lactarius pseudohatsudake]
MSWGIRCLAFVSSMVQYTLVRRAAENTQSICQPRQSEAVQSVNKAFGYSELVREKGRSNHTGGGLIGIQHLRGRFRLCSAYGLSHDQSRFIRCTETELPVVHPVGRTEAGCEEPLHTFTLTRSIFSTVTCPNPSCCPTPVPC